MVRQREEEAQIHETAANNPHQLFMLNKHGQTPLDICIEDECFHNLEATQEDSALSPRTELDLERSRNL